LLDYRPERLGRDAFPADALCAEKDRQNEALLASLRRFLGPDDHIVVLDAATVRTSRALSAAVPARRIHVPNPSRTFISSVAPEHRALFTAHAMTVFELIRDIPLVGRCHFFLDYCGWLDTFANDIRLIFARGLLPSAGGVLRVTVSTRGLPKGSTEAAELSLRTALARDCRIELTEAYSYRSMYHFAWLVSHCGAREPPAAAASFVQLPLSSYEVLAARYGSMPQYVVRRGRHMYGVWGGVWGEQEYLLDPSSDGDYFGIWAGYCAEGVAVPVDASA